MGRRSNSEKFGRPQLIEPTLVDGFNACSMLYRTYGRGSRFNTGSDGQAAPISESVAEQKLLALVDDVLKRRVTSHREIADVVLGIGDNLGLFSGSTLGINDAAISLRAAVLKRQHSFS